MRKIRGKNDISRRSILKGTSMVAAAVGDVL